MSTHISIMQAYTIEENNGHFIVFDVFHSKALEVYARIVLNVIEIHTIECWNSTPNAAFCALLNYIEELFTKTIPSESALRVVRPTVSIVSNWQLNGELLQRGFVTSTPIFDHRNTTFYRKVYYDSQIVTTHTQECVCSKGFTVTVHVTPN